MIMKPDARNLSVNMRGEDVKLLQKRLTELGFSIEDKDGFFGKTTRWAVMEIQKKNGMKATGIVDEATAEVIKNNIDALEQQRFTVHGRVMRSDGAPLAGVTVSAVDWDRAGENLLGTVKTQTDGRYDILSRTSATYNPGKPAVGHGSDELMQFMNLDM
jgi:peptidoglycan hydrolase-like protein with peptidoglycan-binding domain